MDALIQWGLPIVQWLQTFRSPALDLIMSTTYYLGAEDFFILFLSLMFWCIHKSLGMRLTFAFIFSSYLNLVFKDFFAAPRPYQVDNTLYAPFKTEGFGMPSGHAQGAVAFWGYVATQLKMRWWWALAIFMSLFIGIGRMYVGDHFPQDVLLGWALGIVIVAAYAIMQPRVGEWIGKQSLALQIGLGVVVPLALFAVHATSDSAKLMGVALGMFALLPVEEKTIRFDVRATWARQVVKLALGAAVIMALRIGLKAVFPEQMIFDLIRYAAMGAWASLGAPWVFVKARLAESRT
ncbi:MAG: phosphatase PAP2 family protein [Chloroflexi bacterium]|nr:phosphatase PAP2 family protein [Chloroflexota bacterium]